VRGPGARALQALLSWQLERTFCEAAALRFGAPVATATLWLLAGSAGMFHAATAFLPSSFTMLAVLAIWTACLRAAKSRGPGGTTGPLGTPSRTLGPSPYREVPWETRPRASH
jgi:hypothetical protein